MVLPAPLRPGTDSPDDWMRRAQQHRPTNPALLRAAIIELQAQGLKPRDIAQAMRVSLPVVLEAIAHGRQDAA
jgi:DNA-directed RNA polymerase specialized sigma24 family protein